MGDGFGLTCAIKNTHGIEENVVLTRTHFYIDSIHVYWCILPGRFHTGLFTGFSHSAPCTIFDSSFLSWWPQSDCLRVASLGK